MLWSAFRDSCLHAFANRKCKASLAGPTIHEQQPLFSRETWLFVGMWLVTIWNLLCQTHTKLSVTLPRLGINQSIYMTSDAHKILLDSFLWSKHPFTHVYTCSVLSNPSFLHTQNSGSSDLYQSVQILKTLQQSRLANAVHLSAVTRRKVVRDGLV